MDYEVAEGTTTPLRDEAGLYVPKSRITTIEKYFSYLPELIKLGDATSNDEYKVLHSLGRRYTILPIDEDLFDIDANARVINVPGSFVRNGIAVQGDELSEVLYFRIDRFFDAADLDQTDIYIQWTRPDGESGVSKPWVVDIESEPNKIIFGWALSSSITKLTGTLRFAVRFFKWASDETGKLSYSWATQTQTATIKSTLDFTLGSSDYLAELNTDNTIIGRIQNSHSVVVDNEVASNPIYIFNLRDNLVDNAAVGIQTDGFVYIDLIEDPVTHEETYEFKVQAQSEDGGIVSYSWYEKDHAYELGTSADQGADGTKSSTRVGFELTADTEVNSSKIYYQKNETNPISYTPVDVTDLGTDGEGNPYTPASKGLYEKFAYCTVTQIGQYRAVASNRKSGTNPATKDSDVCIVPMPVNPVIDTQLVAREIIPEIDINEEPIDDGEVLLHIDASNTETNGSKDGTLTYTWWYKKNEVDDFVQIKGETEDELLIKNGVLFEDVNNNQLDTLEGYYKIKINNHKNMQNTVLDSAVCRVSYTAEAPVLAHPTNTTDERFKNLGDTLRVILDEPWAAKWNIYDEIHYQWYRSDDIENNTAADDELIEGATERTYTPTANGRYYCVVTNIKNETEASTASYTFSV